VNSLETLVQVEWFPYKWREAPRYPLHDNNSGSRSASGFRMRKGVQIDPAPSARKDPSWLLDPILLRQQEEPESKARRQLQKEI
jgi:hypothetical protein